MANSKRSRSGGSPFVYSTDPGFSFEGSREQEAALPPSAQRLQVRVDTRHRKGKTVTLVEGFAGPDEELETLGRKLKTACGTGGSAKDGIILVQGAHLAEVKDKLKAWGYGLG
jgi:translation initiation factor 1